LTSRFEYPAFFERVVRNYVTMSQQALAQEI